MWGVEELGGVLTKYLSLGGWVKVLDRGVLFRKWLRFSFFSQKLQGMGTIICPPPPRTRPWGWKKGGGLSCQTGKYGGGVNTGKW